jgi:Ran GTPase-activating protein (RanGAP) involved in mRNA processing and transport
MNTVPKHMFGALLQRHVHSGVLDMVVPREALDVAPIADLFPAMTTIPSLRGIKLCSGALCTEDLPDVASILTAHAATLQSLGLCNMAANARCASSVNECLSVFMKSDSESASVLWKALSCCTGLTSLDLRSTHLHPSLAQCLGHTLQEFHNLQVLDLTDTCCTAAFSSYIETMPGALSSLRHLTRLSIASNHLTHATCKELALQLRELRELCVLDVTSCEMQLVSWALLAMSVATIPSMRELLSESIRWGCNVLFGASCHSEADFQSLLASLSRDAEYVFNSSSQPLSGVADRGPDTSVAPYQSNLRVLRLKSLVHSLVSASLLLRLAELPLSLCDKTATWTVTSGDSPLCSSGLRPKDCLRNVELLDLSRTRFASDTIDILASVLASLPSLREVNLSYCQLPASALDTICAPLTRAVDESSAVGLTGLDWSGNTRPAESGMIALCSMTTLKKVVLRDCSIGEMLVRVCVPISLLNTVICRV